MQIEKSGAGILLRREVVAAAFVLLAVGAGVQRLMLAPNVEDGRTYTHYNNYVIFRASFAHLVHGQDLYAPFPDEQSDLFKYSPTFAVLMAPLAALPDAVGLIVWDLAGAALLFAGIWRLPVADERSRMAMAWFLALPMLQSLQNSQSNAQVAGLALLTVAALEAGAAVWAALAIALAFFVKIYGIAALPLVALYPCRLRCSASLAVWLIALAALPLVVVSPSQLVFVYESWGRLLASDQTSSIGVSVMGLLQNWFGVAPSKTALAGIGLAVTLLPLVRLRAYGLLRFRILLLAAVLIWMVIFNHKAEPNTFVIAVAGVAVWYLAGPRSWLRVTLLAMVLVLTCLSTTSIFPVVLRRALIQPFSLRVLPCILVWMVTVLELFLAPIDGDRAVQRFS